MKSKVPELGIMFFSASEESLLVDKYRLVMEAARFADQHGFSSVWVPENRYDEIADIVTRTARTGRIGDGKIFVVPTAWETIEI